MSSEFDGEADEIGPEDCLQAPDYRLVIRGRMLILADWNPDLAGAGQGAEALKRRAAGWPFLADVAVSGETPDDRELVVNPVAGRLTCARRRLITRWAGITGHRRLWLEPEVVEFRVLADPTMVAGVRCVWCGSRWQAHGHDFWAAVNDRRRFPNACRLCGGQLMEWTVV